MNNKSKLSRRWLEDNPEAAYMARITGMTDPLRGFYSNMFSPIYGEYLGALGQEAMTGEVPSLGFGGFLGRYPFMSRFMGDTALSRTRAASRIAPRARHLNY